MTSKSIFSISAVISIAGGIFAVLMPSALMAPFGIALGPVGIHMARLNGTCGVTIGLLLWMTRDWRDWQVIRPIVITALASFFLAFGVALSSTMSGVMNSTGWVNVALDAVLALGFGYLLFVRKTP